MSTETLAEALENNTLPQLLIKKTELEGKLLGVIGNHRAKTDQYVKELSRVKFLITQLDVDAKRAEAILYAKKRLTMGIREIETSRSAHLAKYELLKGAAKKGEVTLTKIPRKLKITPSYSDISGDDVRMDNKVVRGNSTEVRIYYRDYRITVEEHVTEGERFNRGTNRGYEMRFGEGDRMPSYGARWYSSPAGILSKIDDLVESKLQEALKRDNQSRLEKLAHIDLITKYPDANVTKRRSGDYQDSSKRRWREYNVFSIKFVDGSYLEFSVDKSFKEGEKYSLYMRAQFNSHWNTLSNLEKIDYLSNQSKK